MTADERRQARTEYSAELQRFEEYEQALKDYSESPAVLAARQKLQETVRDLEARGLLQYDRQSKRYDLHPVVRGIAAGGLQPWQKERYGQRVVDYFSRKVHSPYENAESLEDIRDTLHVIRALIQMGRCTQAWSTARYAQLGPTLVFNLEAYAESLALIRPFFDDDWSPVQELQGAERSFVASWAAEALLRGGESGQALVAGGVALRTNLGLRAWANLRDDLSVISYALRNLNRVAAQARCVLAALNLANAVGGENLVFLARFHQFMLLAQMGQAAEAETIWKLVNPAGHDLDREVYRPGDADYAYARFLLTQQELTDERLERAQVIANAGKNREGIRGLHALRGQWHFQHCRYDAAAKSFDEAVRMAREVGQRDAESETRLALAKVHLPQLGEHRQEAEHLAAAGQPAHLPLAQLWLAIGALEEAEKHALAAHKWAWADGEPYVHRHELTKSRELLEELGAEIPNLPPYDPAKDEKLPWEDEVAAAIAELLAESESRKAGEESQEESLVSGLMLLIPKDLKLA